MYEQKKLINARELQRKITLMKSGAHGVENGESELGIVAVKCCGDNGTAIGGGNDAVVSGGVVGDH